MSDLMSVLEYIDDNSKEDEPCCGARHPSKNLGCTEDPDHKGDHIATGPREEKGYPVYARWPRGGRAVAAE